MTVSSSGIVSDRLYEQVLPLAYADEANDYALANVVGAIGAMWQDVYDLVYTDDQDHPGWSSIVDIDRAPVAGLAWLAQLVGSRLPQGLSEDQQRDWIEAASGQKRGTPAAMIAAAQSTLTGTKEVILTERTGSAYRLTVVTRVEETPDAAATLKALIAAKPAGLFLTHSTTAEVTWDQAGATRTWDGVGGTITWDAVILSDVT